MEPDMIIVNKWCVTSQQIIEERYETSNGIQIVTRPVVVAKIFRNMKEIHKYFAEQDANGAVQISLQKIAFGIGDLPEYYYEEPLEDEDCEDWT